MELLIAPVFLALFWATARFVPEPERLPLALRSACVLLALVVATVVFDALIFVINTDACIDAGGVQHSAGVCELAPARQVEPYVALVARPAFDHPGLYLSRSTILLEVFAVGFVAYRITARLLGGRSRGEST